MPTYNVTLPISSLLYDEHPSGLAILPVGFELNQVRFQRPAGSVSAQTVYICSGTIAASDEFAAKMEVLRRVNEVLWAMATWNGSYRADASGVVTQEVASDQQEPFSGPVTRIRSVAVRAVIAEQRDTQLEASAFAWRASWPAWLTTALELNYLAVTTRDVRPSLVIHWSILEILADQLEPATTVLALLDTAARDELITTVRNAAKPVLNATSVERVLARINDTQLESTVSRIHAVLRRYSVEAQATDINEVRKQRGKIAHGAGTGNAYEVAERQARTWVQAALRAALTSGVQAPSGGQ